VPAWSSDGRRVDGDNPAISFRTTVRRFVDSSFGRCRVKLLDNQIIDGLDGSGFASHVFDDGLD